MLSKIMIWTIKHNFQKICSVLCFPTISRLNLGASRLEPLVET